MLLGTSIVLLVVIRFVAIFYFFVLSALDMIFFNLRTEASESSVMAYAIAMKSFSGCTGPPRTSSRSSIGVIYTICSLFDS